MEQSDWSEFTTMVQLLAVAYQPKLLWEISSYQGGVGDHSDERGPWANIIFATQL